MKSKPKDTLSPLQRRRFVKIVLALVVLALLWVVFAPNMGILSVRRERARLEQLETRKAGLEQEIVELRREIERLETDQEYFERLAREKFGLLKKNETVFDFSSGKDSDAD